MPPQSQIAGYVLLTREQLVAVRYAANSYHYNTIQAWQTAGDGEVTNVLA